MEERDRPGDEVASPLTERSGRQVVGAAAAAAPAGTPRARANRLAEESSPYGEVAAGAGEVRVTCQACDEERCLRPVTRTLVVGGGAER
jgi:hypothetical protein